MKPYYQTLEVPEDSTQEEIKAKFKKLSKKYHPDKNGGSAESEAKFKEINEAYSVLSDPEKRKQYDHVGMVGTANIEDQAVNNLRELFEESIKMCIERGHDRDKIFINMHMTMNQSICNKKNQILHNEGLINAKEADLLEMEVIKQKSDKSPFQEASTTVEKIIKLEIQGCQSSILQLEADIRLREKMLEILERDYPKEPEREEYVPDYRNWTQRRPFPGEMG